MVLLTVVLTAVSRTMLLSAPGPQQQQVGPYCRSPRPREAPRLPEPARAPQPQGAPGEAAAGQGPQHRNTPLVGVGTAAAGEAAGVGTGAAGEAAPGQGPEWRGRLLVGWGVLWLGCVVFGGGWLVGRGRLWWLGLVSVAGHIWGVRPRAHGGGYSWAGAHLEKCTCGRLEINARSIPPDWMDRASSIGRPVAELRCGLRCGNRGLGSALPARGPPARHGRPQSLRCQQAPIQLRQVLRWPEL